MSPARERYPMQGGEYVRDRNQVIWRVVRDGGMVTTADDVGIVSGGIHWLRDNYGPLTPVEEGAQVGLLCGQCGEHPAAMVKVGTQDGWCVMCLDEAAEPSAQSTVDRDAHAFIGSMSLMDALHETITEHSYTTETDPPNGVEPYIWCGCGWRSDEPPHDVSEAGAALYVHLANALHAAAVPPLAARWERDAARVRAAVLPEVDEDHAEQLRMAVEDTKIRVRREVAEELDPIIARHERAARLASEGGDIQYAVPVRAFCEQLREVLAREADNG